METIKAIIVDDEQDAREALEILLKDYKEIQIVSKESNIDDAVKTVVKETPDIIFLDIDMGDKDGFVLIDEIRKRELNPTIIFVTGYNNRAVEAFEKAAFDYLMKPIDPARLKMSIERYKSEKQKSDINIKIDKLRDILFSKKIKFNTKTGFLFVNINEIIYLEADGNYTNICLSNAKKELLTKQLGQIENILPADTFFRISRSAIINLNFISSINRKLKKVVMINSIHEIELKVSKRKLNLLIEVIENSDLLVTY